MFSFSDSSTLVFEVKMIPFTLHEIKNIAKQKVFHPVNRHKLRPVDIKVLMSLLRVKMSSLVKTHLLMFSAANQLFQIIVIKMSLAIYYLFLRQSPLPGLEEVRATPRQRMKILI